MIVVVVVVVEVVFNLGHTHTRIYTVYSWRESHITQFQFLTGLTLENRAVREKERDI